MNNGQLIDILQRFPREAGIAFDARTACKGQAIRYVYAGEGGTYYHPEKGETPCFLIVLSREEMPQTKDGITRIGPIM